MFVFYLFVFFFQQITPYITRSVQYSVIAEAVIIIPRTCNGLLELRPFPSST